MTGTVTANASIENKSIEANVIFLHLSHRRGDRVALDPSRRCLARLKSRPFQFGRTQEERARTGRTTTDMLFGAFVRTHLRETAGVTRPTSGPKDEILSPVTKSIDCYAWLAAFVAVYSGL